MQYINILIPILLLLLLSGCGGANTPLAPTNTVLLAEQGDAASQNNLASMYQFGDGVPLDYKKAVALYEESAAQGLVMAKVNLGYMYDNGLGIEQDKQKALALYKEAAYLKEPRGMINLAEMYRLGDNIEQSNTKAYMWSQLARFYTQFTKDMEAKWTARAMLDALKKEMSPEEINLGEKLATEWISNNR